MKPRISIVAAMDEKRGIGKNNRIPWRLKDDLIHLKKLTLGHATILGRSSFESMLSYYEKSGRTTMQERPHIVLTMDPTYEVSRKYGFVAHSVEEALRRAEEIEKEEIFIIGGAKVFEQFLQYVERLYVTIIKGAHEADAFFPEYKNIFTKEIEREDKEENGMKYSFVTLEK